MIYLNIDFITLLNWKLIISFCCFLLQILLLWFFGFMQIPMILKLNRQFSSLRIGIHTDITASTLRITRIFRSLVAVIKVCLVWVVPALYYGLLHGREHIIHLTVPTVFDANYLLLRLFFVAHLQLSLSTSICILLVFTLAIEGNQSMALLLFLLLICLLLSWRAFKVLGVEMIIGACIVLVRLEIQVVDAFAALNLHKDFATLRWRILTMAAIIFVLWL